MQKMYSNHALFISPTCDCMIGCCIHSTANEIYEASSLLVINGH